MSDLIAVAYPDESRAAGVRAMLAQLQHEHEYLADLEDAVVVTKDKDGKLKLHQSMNLASKGAVGGGIWGGLIGLIFLVPFVGAAAGAAAGALIGKFSDYGIDDGFVKELSAKMAPRSLMAFLPSSGLQPSDFTRVGPHVRRKLSEPASPAANGASGRGPRRS